MKSVQLNAAMCVAQVMSSVKHLQGIIDRDETGAMEAATGPKVTLMSSESFPGVCLEYSLLFGMKYLRPEGLCFWEMFLDVPQGVRIRLIYDGK